MICQESGLLLAYNNCCCNYYFFPSSYTIRMIISLTLGKLLFLLKRLFCYSGRKGLCSQGLHCCYSPTCDSLLQAQDKTVVQMNFGFYVIVRFIRCLRGLCPCLTNCCLLAKSPNFIIPEKCQQRASGFTSG